MGGLSTPSSSRLICRPGTNGATPATQIGGITRYYSITGNAAPVTTFDAARTSIHGLPFGSGARLRSAVASFRADTYGSDSTLELVNSAGYAFASVTVPAGSSPLNYALTIHAPLLANESNALAWKFTSGGGALDSGGIFTISMEVA